MDSNCHEQQQSTQGIVTSVQRAFLGTASVATGTDLCRRHAGTINQAAGSFGLTGRCFRIVTQAAHANQPAHTYQTSTTCLSLTLTCLYTAFTGIAFCVLFQSLSTRMQQVDQYKCSLAASLTKPAIATMLVITDMPLQTKWPPLVAMNADMHRHPRPSYL